MNTAELFISVINSEVFKREIPFPDELNKEDIDALYAISKKHDLAHIVASFLEKRNIITDGFTRQKLLAVYRREQLDLIEERVCRLFDGEGIDHIALKGAVMKGLYPEKWMRTSSDVDILIRPDDRERAISLITENLAFTVDTDAERDCSLISKSGMNLELHFGITCNDAKLDTVLSRVWEFAIPENEHKFTLKDEFFIFYHIAHMQLHFSEGGCGVRPFIDLWLYKDKLEKCENAVTELLSMTESVDFYKGVKALCGVWFNNAEHGELTKLIEAYIISGGVYGTRENLGATGRHKSGNRFKYILNRIFMPKEKLRLVYPKIDKYPLLIPYYQLKRWMSLLDKEKRVSARNELSGGKNSESADKMLRYLGL